MWSSVDAETGIYCSISQPSDTSGGYEFGEGGNTLTQGLAAWWKMDNCPNPVADSSGNNIDATKMGGSVVAAVGKDGGACELQGGYINVPSSILKTILHRILV